MDYAQKLQQINTAKEEGNASELQQIKKEALTEQAQESNMGNTMVLMAAQNALEKLNFMNSDAVVEKRRVANQVVNAGGNVNTLGTLTQSVDSEINKAELKGRLTILSAIPESMRTAAQEEEMADARFDLGISPETKASAIKVPIPPYKQEYNYDFSKAKELPDYAQLANNGPSYEQLANGTMNNYAENMESQIASGSNLWDAPTDNPVDQSSFTVPITLTREDLDESHKSYLRQQIDSISSNISAGIGTQEEFDRGISLENKLAEYDAPKFEAPASAPDYISTEPVSDSEELDLEDGESDSTIESLIGLDESDPAFQLVFEQRLLKELKENTRGMFDFEFGTNATLDAEGYIIRGDGTETNYTPSMIDYVGPLRETRGISPEELRQSVISGIKDEINHAQVNGVERVLPQVIKSPEDITAEKRNAIMNEWENELANPTVDMESYLNSRTDLSDDLKLKMIDGNENEKAGIPRAVGAFKYLSGKITAEEFLAPGGHEFGDGTYGYYYKKTLPNMKAIADQQAEVFKGLYNKINAKYQQKLDDLKENETKIKSTPDEMFANAA